MKRLVLAGLLGAAVVAAGLPVAHLSAQAADRQMALGTVRLTKKVMADGKPLDAGTYQVRLTNDHPQPAAGASPDGEQYVEFMKSGKVVAREVATVVSKDDIGSVAKGKKPAPGSSLVEMLKGNDYLRVWINKGGTNYIINLPTSA